MKFVVESREAEDGVAEYLITDNTEANSIRIAVRVAPAIAGSHELMGHEFAGAFVALRAVRDNRPMIGLRAKGPDGRVAHIIRVERANPGFTPDRVQLAGGPLVDWAQCTYEGV